MDSFVESVMREVLTHHPHEPEFHQAVREMAESVTLVYDRHPEYRHVKVFERIIEPERVILFRVPWMDDRGEIQINRGYRVQMNSALGPYKGGLRFHPSVTLSILKFLAFEQVFKNSLTGLPLGGGKGGADFNPRGRSDNEVMRFCQSFMTELFRHIGPDTDIPAGDIGVGGREIGYLFGMYKRLHNEFTGALTGKGIGWGGSLVRPEATGFGVVYFVEEMLSTRGETLAGKRVSVSGFGNVAWGVVTKLNDLGARVITLSGPDGYIVDESAQGISGEKIVYMLRLRATNEDIIEPFVHRFKEAVFVPKKRPWEVPCDIAIPCATQNELDHEDAQRLIQNGCFCICEGANMPCTLDAVRIIRQNGLLFGPSKAANAGGVAVSGLEMTQNAMKIQWSREEVDRHLRRIMQHIHKTCLETAERFGVPGDYLTGANIGGFLKVADAMMDQGLV